MESLFTARFMVVGRNGTRREGLRAVVDTGRILTIDVETPVEEGDQLVRTLPNGVEDRYVVRDITFQPGHGSLPATYSFAVERVKGGSRATMSGIRVFVSHSSDDADLAEKVVDLLQAATGLSAEAIRCTSVDGHRLPIGADTAGQLRDELLSAPVFVGVISTASFESAYVLFELGARWGAKKNLKLLLAPGFDVRLLRGPVAALHVATCEGAGQLHQFVRECADDLGIECKPPDSYQRFVERVLGHARTHKPSEPGPKPVSEHELSKEKLGLLIKLAEAGGHGLPAAELADRLRDRESNVQFLLDELLPTGLLRRLPNAMHSGTYGLTHDGRRFLAELDLL